MYSHLPVKIMAANYDAKMKEDTKLLREAHGFSDPTDKINCLLQCAEHWYHNGQQSLDINLSN